MRKNIACVDCKTADVIVAKSVGKSKLGASGIKWYGFRCHTCYLARVAVRKRNRMLNKSEDTDFELGLGPNEAPKAKMYKCRKCLSDTHNKYMCSACHLKYDTFTAEEYLINL